MEVLDLDSGHGAWIYWKGEREAGMELRSPLPLVKQGVSGEDEDVLDGWR